MQLSPPKAIRGFTLNMNILCNLLQWEKMPLKNVHVSSAWDHYTHYGLSQQKRPFISNCRVDADFLKAIDWKWHSWGAGEEPWMETVDSHFHRSPAVSSIAAWPWRGGRGPSLHMVCFSWDLRHSAVTSIRAWAYSFERFHLKRARWKQPLFSLHTFCTHAPVCTNCHHWHSSPSGFISWTLNHWHKLNNW